MSRAPCFLSLFALALLIPVGACGAETAGIQSGSVYKLVAKCSSKCLNVSQASAADGANVQQWTENGTNAQNWRIDYVGGDYYKLTAISSGKVLEVESASTADGVNVRQWSDLGADTQRWKITASGGGFFKLTNKATSKILDVNGASTGEGANVQQWSDNGTSAQRWAISLSTSQVTGALVSAGNYLLVAKHSSQALSVSGNSTVDGAGLVQGSVTGLAGQQWQIQQVPAGTYQLTSVLTGKVADISGASTADGAHAIQWHSHGGSNQRFSIKPSSGDYQSLIAVHSGKALGVAGSSQAQNAFVVQHGTDAGDSQRWKLTPVYACTLSSVPVAMVVAVGDYVKVTSQVAGTVTGYEACGTATVSPFAVASGVEFLLPTTAPGYFSYIARDAQGNELGEIQATVVRTNLSQLILADHYGYTRQIAVTIEPAGAPVTLASTDIALLTVGVPTTVNTTSTLPIRLNAGGDAYVVAQIQSPAGTTTIARTLIKGFAASTTATTGLTFISYLADNSMLVEATLTMAPHIGGLDVHMTTFTSGVTFDDSTTVHDATTNQFSLVAPSSQLTYRMLRAPSYESNFCHSYVFFQNGFQVSR